MYKVCTEAVHSVALWTRVTLGLDMCKVCTKAVHSLALWTRVTLGLDMCKVCTEAVHSVALWTRVTLGLDMCKVCTETVHSVALWTRVTLGLDMCKVCTEAVHSVALWTCPGNLVSSMGERGGWRQQFLLLLLHNCSTFLPFVFFACSTTRFTCLLRPGLRKTQMKQIRKLTSYSYVFFASALSMSYA